MTKTVSVLWRVAAVLLSLAGVAGFIVFFVPGMNIYWFILSPMIIAVYEIPAVVVYYLWKKRRARDEESREER
jgi:membrane protein YdbS with pleckstrin-like domain